MSVKFWNYNLVAEPATVITADSVDAFFPLENLKDPRATKVFRSLTPSVSIVFDLVTSQPVDSILLAPHSRNGWGFTTPVTIEANPTNTWGAPAYSNTVASGDLDQVHNIAIKEFTEQAYRFWRLTFDASEYVEVGKIFIGTVLKVGSGRSQDYGWAFQERDNSIATLNRYGQRFVDIVNRQKVINMQLSLLNRDEMDDVFQIWDHNSTIRPFWFWIDGIGTLNNTRRHSGIFYLDEMPQAVNVAHALYSMSISMSEAM